MRKIVFLVCNEFDNVSSSLPLLDERVRNGASLQVIALDTLAAREIRQLGMPCKTPTEYLQVDNDDEMVEAAVTYAQTWHIALKKELSYGGISLGDLVENPFLSIFVCAIRCGEIAKKIISQEAPDEIIMPQKTVSEPPYSFAYELLPEAVEYLAASKGIKITKVRQSSRATAAELLTSVKTKIVSLTFGTATRIGIIYSSFLSRHSKRKSGKIAIVYSCVSQRHLIVEALGKDVSVNLQLHHPCLADYMLKMFIWKPKRIKAQFRRLWSELAANKQFEGWLTYRTIPLFAILRSRFEELFVYTFPNLVAFIAWVDKSTERLDPDLLVLMEDAYPVHKTLCNVFKRHNIPVLVLQHGAYADGVRLPVGPFCADKQAVWGSISQEWHVQMGKPRDSQVVTGNYKFDVIASGYPVEKEVICDKLGLDPSKRIVVVATSWYANISVRYTPESEERSFSLILEALKRFPREQVVIKLHPTFHQTYRNTVAAIVNELGIRATITKDYLRELLIICDLLICENSTVGLEAMILGKPVVTINIDDLPQIPYERYGAALSVRAAEEIAPAIDAALNNTEVRERLLHNARQFVRDYAYLQDANASKRVAELMMDMARGS